MGLFDEAEKLAQQNPSVVNDLTGQAEQTVDNVTGNHFSSELGEAGDEADRYLESDSPQ